MTFEDYTSDELVDIFKSMCKNDGYLLGDGCDIYLKDYFTYVYDNRDDTFANGREVRNYFEKVKVRQANRLVLMDDLSDDELMILEISDLQEEVE